MDILKFTVTDNNIIMLKLKATEEEVIQLKGNVEDLCVFSADCISDHAHVITTGARANAAKYLLLPVSIRRQFKGYDYDNAKCGFIVTEDKRVFFIYSVNPK